MPKRTDIRSIMIIGAGLDKTGLMSKVASVILKYGGSTETRIQLGARRADDLQRAHDDIVRTAIVANGGRVVRSTGDGVKAAFAASSAALGDIEPVKSTAEIVSSVSSDATSVVTLSAKNAATSML